MCVCVSVCVCVHVCVCVRVCVYVPGGGYYTSMGQRGQKRGRDPQPLCAARACVCAHGCVRARVCVCVWVVRCAVRAKYALLALRLLVTRTQFLRASLMLLILF